MCYTDVLHIQKSVDFIFLKISIKDQKKKEKKGYVRDLCPCVSDKQERKETVDLQEELSAF